MQAVQDLVGFLPGGVGVAGMTGGVQAVPEMSQRRGQFGTQEELKPMHKDTWT